MSRTNRCPFDIAAVCRETFIRHVEYHAALSSTNTTALELLEPLLNIGPAVVLTASQTNGRGRKGNSWWSSPGALTFSIVLDPAPVRLSVEQRPLLSLVTGLAVRDAVAEHLPDHVVKIKWPNDVMVDQHKISGILAEQHSIAARQGLIIGIGVNVNNSLRDAPVDVRQRATSMFDLHHHSFDLTAVLIGILRQLDLRIQQLGQQTMSLLAEANHRHLLSGKHVSIQVADNVIAGECLGIDDGGSLVIRDADQIHRISSGIVLNWNG